MEALIQIFSQIPTWVVAVLLYGIVMGVRAMFVRRVSLVAISVPALVFLGLSLTSLVAAVHAVPVGAFFWALGIAAGILAGMTIFSAKIVDADAGGGRMTIAGSPVSLILFVLIFATKFYYNMHIAMQPHAASDPVFVSTVLALSGAGTGIMIGRVSKLFAGYFGRGALASAD